MLIQYNPMQDVELSDEEEAAVNGGEEASPALPTIDDQASEFIAPYVSE